MEEQFVTFEIAMLLKQKGFNDICFAGYRKNKKIDIFKSKNLHKNYWSDKELVEVGWIPEEIERERTKGRIFEKYSGHVRPLFGSK